MYVNAPPGVPGQSDVYRSIDGGATFSSSLLKGRTPEAGGGDADLAIDPTTGHLAMTDLWLGSSTVSTSTDHGATWMSNPVQGVVIQDRPWIATSGNGVGDLLVAVVFPGG